MKSSKCPFEKDKLYQVVSEWRRLVHYFKPGDIVRFEGEIYDRFLECTQYIFWDADGRDMNIWFVSDFEEPAAAQWSRFFKEVPRTVGQ